jgi:Mn2+/Fe2+ NRAMP family transporter
VVDFLAAGLAAGFLTAGLVAGFATDFLAAGLATGCVIDFAAGFLAIGFFTTVLAAGFLAAGLAAGFAAGLDGATLALGFLTFDLPRNLSKIATYFFTPQSLDALKGLSNRPAQFIFCHELHESHFDGAISQRVNTPLAS